jgi:hypothetical protein
MPATAIFFPDFFDKNIRKEAGSQEDGKPFSIPAWHGRPFGDTESLYSFYPFYLFGLEKWRRWTAVLGMTCVMRRIKQVFDPGGILYPKNAPEKGETPPVDHLFFHGSVPGLFPGTGKYRRPEKPAYGKQRRTVIPVDGWNPEAVVKAAPRSRRRSSGCYRHKKALSPGAWHEAGLRAVFRLCCYT